MLIRVWLSLAWLYTIMLKLAKDEKASDMKLEHTSGCRSAVVSKVQPPGREFGQGPISIGLEGTTFDLLLILSIPLLEIRFIEAKHDWAYA